jgi:metal-responsive CopG/Arc/MetJ family transcriptional regulator
VFSPKIRIDKALYERVARCAEKAGYSSTDEFIVHLLQREVESIEEPEDDPRVEERLRGLGYLE